jgi:hypothetical protein
MARTPQDDPDAARRLAEPLIVSAVASELSKRGLSAAETPDLHVTYFLLLTVGSSAQVLGQFLPSTPEWGLPPFAPATQSLQFMHHGSLVLDFSDATQKVVWRGVARANIKVDADDQRREALISEAVRDLLRRFPPRS